MQKNEIKIPIALQKDTNKLVNATEVENGLACNCYCPECKEDLKAKNREIKQRAHFSHHDKTNCTGNAESYIHWLAKEVLKSLKIIKLPRIEFNNISHLIDWDWLQNQLENIYKKHNLPSEFQITYGINLVIKKEQEFKPKIILKEKKKDSELGSVRVDIYAKLENHELLIEPFYTNRIDEVKLEKLKRIDKTTVSINLVEFIDKYGWYFSLEDFKSYLISAESKEWIYFSKNSVRQFTSTYFNLLQSKLIDIRDKIEHYKKIIKQIYEKEEQIRVLQIKELEIINQRDIINNKRSKILEEIASNLNLKHIYDPQTRKLMNF